jgi:hypothetical protein
LIRFCTLASTVFLLACDQRATTGVSTTCRSIAQAAPSTATIAIGSSVNVALALEAACPIPLIRNETPILLQVDSLAPASIRVTGRASGSGRVRVRSGVDTLVSAIVSVTVMP